MEALTLAQVGLGPWGSNLARNFNELARLKWICDVDGEAHARVGSRFPSTKYTDQFDGRLKSRIERMTAPFFGITPTTRSKTSSAQGTLGLDRNER